MSNFSDAVISFGVRTWSGLREFVGGEERSGGGLVDEAEEGFSAAGDDEAEEFCVGGGYLVGVDCGLWGPGDG